MKYIEATYEAGKDLFLRNIQGPVVMLNLLKFKQVADYSAAPHLAPIEPISGAEAYQLYIKHTSPFLEKSGGQVLFLGKGGPFLIGPASEEWDLIMLVRQASVGDFFAFASNEECMAGIGHRIAALEDSRLLPLVPQSENDFAKFYKG